MSTFRPKKPGALSDQALRVLRLVARGPVRVHSAEMLLAGRGTAGVFRALPVLLDRGLVVASADQVVTIRRRGSDLLKMGAYRNRAA